MAIANDATKVQTNLADELAAVAEALTRSTVQVQARRSGGGSGVIWNAKGLIITNAHVARSPRATIELWDGRVYDGVVTARDTYRDLAAIAIDAEKGGGIPPLPAATIGDSDALRVGELAIAVGNPLGVVGALTMGIVHAIAPDSGHLQKWVKADVRLAPGNSGGPLADANGRVIGINTMIAQGLALAVPIDAVKRFLQGSEDRPVLGITMQPVVVPLRGKRVLGLWILEVADKSPAMEAGIETGDVLIGVFGQLFNTPDDLASVLNNAKPGDRLPFELLRGTQRRSCTVVVRGGTGVKLT